MQTTSWHPSASIETLQQRAKLIKNIRRFFEQRDYLEVETPAMSRFAVTDVYLNNIEASFRQKTYYLQTSPEYHMKRLLAAGSGPIFQLVKVFRDDELGRWHNPEFTMLEWYRPGIDHHALMEEVNQLLREVLHCPVLIKKTYQQVFKESCEIDPFKASLSDLRQILTHFGLDGVLPENEVERDQYLFLLMSHVIEPFLAETKAPVAVYDFPASQAALAKTNTAGFAERFEVYYKGVELANGFHELTDVGLQSARFHQDNVHRKARGLSVKPIDEYFLQALNSGLPECSGVALGIDRLIALSLDKPTLADVMAFDFNRA
ncbi:elongation factor P--(R)-beta-lysine ligase [Legionella israelensis]|uniref:Lysyl-tRNA synthetase n=1 Tax=Legionella israelensis TaxID=454 RepID=A0A0W0WN58_9GAMM|nr:elongation factor P--(R)-beta-lysine ligase [Legionella israelensis]KTD33761.1 lysyl-tRNA synthetase [Legionella israelensis]QBS09254.1 elongation factor P--(R)-beta-lysine ligase [Legionella israelensis]QDP71894.1 elongation factor P--(R)-beta-lysine ligase [Legionella israelensis]SCY31519.1 lysyl-tRNA synthetase, class 2 [Legionella israelensis DSM 19235]STX59002.1 lysyl-tRNA synthetase [Legionella israelensis]